MTNEHDENDGWRTEEIAKIVAISRHDLYQKPAYPDVQKLTQIGIDTTQFFQWMNMKSTDCASLFHLIPAYFEHQMSTHSDYDGAGFEMQLIKLGLTSDCITFIEEQSTRYENDNKQNAAYYALQHCLHQFHRIYQIPLNPPLTSTALNQIKTFDIEVTNELLPGNFQLVTIKNYHTNKIKISLHETGLINEVSDVKLLFHATQVPRATHIFRYGLDLMGFRLNLDFDPGFYLNTSFRDAKDWCELRIAPYNGGEAAIIIFEIPVDVYNTWNIHKLDYQTPKEQVNNLTEWQYVVQSCRAGDINNRARHRYGGLEGPQCCNPQHVASDAPKIRYTREDPPRIAWQINLHSSDIQGRIMDFSTNVITFTDI